MQIYGRGGAEANSKDKKSSRCSGFSKMSVRQRADFLVENHFLTADEAEVFLNSGALTHEQSESFIENSLGGFVLPLGIATNFLIDGEEVLVPMAVEESSVVAAASHGAKLARSTGGFFSDPVKTIATCQIQFTSLLPYSEIEHLYNLARQNIHARANACHPKLVERGGGVTGSEIRQLSKTGVYVLHIHVDTKEAMGANIVNTIAEECGRCLTEWFPCQVGIKILTNLCTQRVVKVHCEVEPSVLALAGYSGEEAIDRICMAMEFAELDPFRATTHNKGVMNGIDPVVIASGNDWRAVEAGCHAYAAFQKSYSPMTSWRKTEQGKLYGKIEIPIAVGTVGGVTRLHPSARAALKIMGNPSSEMLSVIMASVGLAQNLSALRALACEGIQKGHMALHEKNLEMLRRYDHLPAVSALSSEK